MRQVVIGILIGLAFSCSKIEHDNEELANSEFQKYLLKFHEEANLRGHDYTHHNVDFYFADINSNDVGGLCYNNKKIVIDREKWNSSNEPWREWLIFHELGHCILDREHRNIKTDCGECISYMKGQENNFDCSINLYSELWKKYYLDELFDENASLPDWYIDNQDYDYTYDNVEPIVSFSNVLTDNVEHNLSMDSIENCLVEVRFKDWEMAAEDEISVGMILTINGYKFLCSPLSHSGQLRIENYNSIIFYENNYNAFTEDIKLTIRKIEEIFQFYINEEFVHALDINTFHTNKISAKFITTPSDNQISMDFNAFVFQ